MAHCSRCLIPWGGNGKKTMMTFLYGIFGPCEHMKHGKIFTVLFLQMVCT
jgi:hypothetical protein